MAEQLAVGIDLGTTFSCIGMWRNNHVEIIANKEGGRTTPSYVSYTNSEVLVGEPARNKLSSNQQNTVYDMKRLIGNKNPEECINRNAKYWTFKVKHDPDVFVEININGASRRIKPEEVSSQILTKLKQSGEEVARQPIRNIVLTVPAYFDECQKKATITAAEMAGLNVLELISEPSAAAYYYGYDQNQDPNDNLLIFDLGGGTLDVVIMEVKNGIFNVVTIGGDTQLGGRDFDNALMDYFVDIIEKKYKKKISDNVMQKLMKECIALKHLLSSTNEANLFLSEFVPDIDENIQMIPQTFNKICFNLLHRIEMVIYGTLQETNMTTDQINRVILVGGSSRIPGIKETLERIFTGVELNFSLNADEAIAIGATLRAKQIITNDDILVNEANARRLGATNQYSDKVTKEKDNESSIKNRAKKIEECPKNAMKMDTTNINGKLATPSTTPLQKSSSSNQLIFWVLILFVLFIGVYFYNKEPPKPSRFFW